MNKRAFAAVASIIILIVGFLLKETNIIGTVPSDYKGGSEAVTVQAPEEINGVKSQGLAANRFVFAQVTRVVDGDTLEVEYKSREYKVRLLDVDTPESVKQGVKEQPYSKDAFKFTENMVLNQKVKLVFEKGLKDRYQRLLAHVVLEDGRYLNGMLVRDGFARVEIVSPNRKMAEYFYDLQSIAFDKKEGLWGLPEKERPFIKNSKGNYIPRYLENRKAS